LNVLHVARYHTLGPVDELQHLDAAIRAPEGDFIGSGDKFSQEALRIESCRGVDSPGFVVPPCPKNDQVRLRPADYQEGGYNTAYIHPPTFYLIDGGVGRLIDATLPGSHDLLTSIRLAGLIWVVAGVVMTWLLLAEVGTGLAARASLVGLVIGSLAVLEATATVNVDATAIPLGAGVLWGVLRWHRRAGSAFWPIAFAVLASATKVTNVLGVGVALLYLLAAGCGLMAARPLVPLRARWRDELRDHRREVRLAGALVVAVLVPAVLWLVGQRLLQVVPPADLPMNKRFEITTFPWAYVTANWKQGLSPLSSPNIIPILDGRWTYFWLGLTDAAVVVLAAAGSMLAPARSPIRIIGVSALACAVAVGPAVVVFNALIQGTYVPIPPRYALSIVPALLVAAVPVVRSRFGLAVVATIAAGSIATLLHGLL
jgi:hypothetical protein